MRDVDHNRIWIICHLKYDRKIQSSKHGHKSIVKDSDDSVLHL
jgi:hypothetical protein